jgi:hypothetical protein
MKLRTFLKHATKRERTQLATVCNDSVAYLYQMAGQHRHASPQMATRLEQVSRQMAAQSDGRLELVPRESLVRHPEIFSGLLTGGG